MAKRLKLEEKLSKIAEHASLVQKRLDKPLHEASVHEIIRTTSETLIGHPDFVEPRPIKKFYFINGKRYETPLGELRPDKFVPYKDGRDLYARYDLAYHFYRERLISHLSSKEMLSDKFTRLFRKFVGRVGYLPSKGLRREKLNALNQLEKKLGHDGLTELLSHANAFWLKQAQELRELAKEPKTNSLYDTQDAFINPLGYYPGLNWSGPLTIEKIRSLLEE